MHSLPRRSDASLGCPYLAAIALLKNSDSAKRDTRPCKSRLFKRISPRAATSVSFRRRKPKTCPLDLSVSRSKLLGLWPCRRRADARLNGLKTTRLASVELALPLTHSRLTISIKTRHVQLAVLSLRRIILRNRQRAPSGSDPRTDGSSFTSGYLAPER